MVKLDEIGSRVYVYETAGPGALAWLRSCWERVFFGPKQYELEDLGERGLAFRCTLEPRLFGPTTQQEEKALAAFKQAWEILRAGWAKVLGNLSAQERENAPRYFDFLQLKTILPIYAPDGRYIEAWQALYELSLPLAPAQDSLSRPPRVLLEGEYLSLELRGNYLAKAVFAHLPVQARRGSDLFAERFTQPTAMLFKRVNGRFLAPFFMGENGASPACKEAVGVALNALDELPIVIQDKAGVKFDWFFNNGNGSEYDESKTNSKLNQYIKNTVEALNFIIKYKSVKSDGQVILLKGHTVTTTGEPMFFDPPTIEDVFRNITSKSFLGLALKGNPVHIKEGNEHKHIGGDIEFAPNLTIWDIGAQYIDSRNGVCYVPPFLSLYHEIGHLHLYVKYYGIIELIKKESPNAVFRNINTKEVRVKKAGAKVYYGDGTEHDIVMLHYEVPLSKVAKVIVRGEILKLNPRPTYSQAVANGINGLQGFLADFAYLVGVPNADFDIKQPLATLKNNRKSQELQLYIHSKGPTTWEPEGFISFLHSVYGEVFLNQLKNISTIDSIVKEWREGELSVIGKNKTPRENIVYSVVNRFNQVKQYIVEYKGKNTGAEPFTEIIQATNER